MQLPVDEIKSCPECGCAMDVSTLSPFTNVKCPECGGQTRVKCRLGNYELKKRQGVGGMSLVFGAVDLTLGREVAIKILNEAYSMDEKHIAQFEQEAQITAGISHPHVVRVYTVGKAFGCFFIAMEMVAGGSLEQKMAEKGAMEEAEIVSIALQVTEGLNAAHRAGLIHRDIKPGNILFDNEGHAKIVDFGLALVTQGGKAKADEIWATPYYVPPEALDGGHEDFRGDIYALGASLYHALSGRPPFEQETKSTTELRKIKSHLPSLKKAAPWISDGLCMVIDKCMAFDPMERYGSYEELHSALKHYDAFSQQVGEETAPISARAKRRIRQKFNSKNWIWGAVGAAAIGMGVAYTILTREPAEDAATDGGGGEILVADNGGQVTEAKMKLIAAELSSARNLLQQGNYNDASNRLMKLARDPEVPSETVYWAGLQASIASWLDGRSADARHALMEVRNRQGDAGRDKSTTGKKLDKATELLMQFPPVSSKQLGEVDDDLDKMIFFAAALKNWEQGAWDVAGPLLREFEGFDVSDDAGELRYYQSLVSEYLYDMELMQPYSKEFNPLTIQEAKIRYTELVSLGKKLKTRGRAPYNVESLQAQLSLQISALETKLALDSEVVEPVPKVQKKDAEEEWKQVRKDVEDLIEQLELSKASGRLKNYNPEAEAKKQWREQMIYLTEAGTGFLAAIYRDLKGEGGDYSILGRDGQTKYDRILGSSEEGLEAMSEGEKKLLLWRDIEPASMLGLHNQLTRTGLNDFEKSIRLEQAIAYAWLVGEKEKAKIAAGKLSEENPAFKRRWESCMDVLK